MPGLLNSIDIEVVEPAAALGTTLLTSDAVDMSGYDGCLFVALVADILDTSVLTLTAQHDDNSSFTSATAESTTAAATSAGDDDLNNKLLLLDYVKPTERYVRCTLARATANAAIGGILAIKYRGAKPPITQTDAAAVAASVEVVGT